MNLAEPRHALNPWIVTIAVMLATFMEILDTTAVNVSTPHLATWEQRSRRAGGS